MLKIKWDINQLDLKRVYLHFVKSDYFSLTWSCGSRQRDTTSNGWKFKLNNLAVKGLIQGCKIIVNFKAHFDWNMVLLSTLFAFSFPGMSQKPKVNFDIAQLEYYNVKQNVRFWYDLRIMTWIISTRSNSKWLTCGHFCFNMRNIWKPMPDS